MNNPEATQETASQQSVAVVHPLVNRSPSEPGDNLISLVKSPMLDNYEKDYIDFIDLAAHELDAPLRKLLLLVGRLSEKMGAASNSPDLQAYLDRIHNCVQGMQGVVDSMTVLSKSGSAVPEIMPCDLEKIVAGVVESMSSVLNGSNGDIHMSSLPTIEGDRNQLCLLFKNLIENALKFHKDGIAPSVKIASSMLTTEEKDHLNLSANKVYHKIEVTDHGIGFKPDSAEKIFKPFIRLNGKSKYAGSGIGLTICKKIVDNHRGLINATSDPEAGTKFIIVLPQIL